MNPKRFGAIAVVVLVVLFVIATLRPNDSLPTATAVPDVAERAANDTSNASIEPVEVLRQVSRDTEDRAENVAPDDGSSCEWVAVAPDYPEFEVSTCHDTGIAATAFAEEQEDPIWAYDTEDAIRALIANHDLGGFARTDVDCRLTSCGIVSLWPPGILPLDAAARELNRAANRLSEIVVEQAGFGRQLGFHGVQTRDDRRIAVQYFLEAEGRALYSQAQPSTPILPMSTFSGSQALPGYPGIDVSFPPMGGAGGMNHGERLAAESDDPSWARPMESQIAAEFSQAVKLPISQLQVECRTTRCGLVFLSTEGSGTSDLQLLFDRLESQLGLRNVGMGFGGIGGQLIHAEYFQHGGRAEE